jgi:membrane protein implicated in regulation of membrane protease activity
VIFEKGRRPLTVGFRHDDVGVGMLAFLIIGGVGIVLMLVSLVAGEIFDGLLEGVGGDLLSGAAIAGFLAAFGFVGALTLNGTGSGGLAIGAGLVAGVAIGGLAGWGTSLLSKGGDEANVRSSALTGRSGTVISAIPVDGYGQVSIVVAGHITQLNARSGEPMPSGTSVTVTAVLSPTSVLVERR